MVEVVDLKNTTKFALEIRRAVLAMGVVAQGSHIAPSFSIADLLAVLYGKILNISGRTCEDDNRDRFVLSKGHASAAIFATLGLMNFFDKKLLKTFCKNGSILGGHPDVIKVPGIEASTGSLGHGFGMACGMAFAAKVQRKSFMVYSIVGDGESQEGSVWETAMAASKFQLDNFVGITDFNKLQGMGFVRDISNLDSIVDRWDSFGWNVYEVDGHDVEKLIVLFNKIKNNKNNRPHMVIAHTVKGKGCSFMENKAIWHYRLPDENELEIACLELGIDDFEKVLE